MKLQKMPTAALTLLLVAGVFWNAGPLAPARYVVLWGVLSACLLPPLLGLITADGLRSSGCLLLLPVLMAALAAQYARELWRFYVRAYPEQLTLPGFLLFLLLGCGCYLYNGSRGFARYHQLLFALLAVAAGVLILSLVGSVHLQNLQYSSDKEPSSSLARGALLQFQLWPEYFFLAVSASTQKPRAVWGAVALTVGTQAFLVLLAELCLGTAAFSYPFYGAACLGQVSVFTRLDQLQVMVWSMLLLCKLGFYLLAVLKSRPPLQAASVLAAAAVLIAQPQTAQWVLQGALWLVLLLAIGGSVRCKDPYA